MCLGVIGGLRDILGEDGSGDEVEIYDASSWFLRLSLLITANCTLNRWLMLVYIRAIGPCVHFYCTSY